MPRSSEPSRLYGVELPGDREPEHGQDLIIDDEPQDRPTSKYLEGIQQSQRADELVRKILNLAVKSRASDIYIEALDRRIRIRFRLDGVLNELDLGSLQGALDRNRAAPVRL